MQNNSNTGLIWQYASAKESPDVVKIQPKQSLFIDNQFIKPLSGKYIDTLNPATSKKISEIAIAGKTDVDKALISSQKAFKSWKKISGKERGKYLFRIARLIQERAKELAVLESIDGGKPIRESRDFDIPLAAQHFFYYAGWADKIPYAFPNKKTEPIGIAAQIIPWNFPLLMAAWKIAPALACGNVVVLKPAETTSLSALLLAEIIRESGLPPGVVNIITGAGPTGELLFKHPLINKVAFTGSTLIGKHIQKELAGSRKKLSLELGGKAAHIVLDDAPIDQAIEGVINGIFFNQGHVCCAGSRLFVQENISDEFIRKLKNRMKTLIVGDPLDKNTDIGAINSSNQLKKIHTYIDEAKQEGLELYQTGTIPTKGFYCVPTLVLGAGQSHKIVQEEIFGPVLSIQIFRTIEEVIEKANQTAFGLSAGVWSNNGARVFNLTSKLRAGVIWANTYNKFDPASPFGGYKESGFGREGGMHGLSAYLK